MKSQKLFKLVALTLAMLFCFGIFAACTGGENPDTTPNPDQTQSGGQTGEQTPLVVGYSPFSGKFSPFFSDTAYDQDVASIVNIGAMTTDRRGEIVWNAIEGETRDYEGTSYEYKGAANIEVKKGEPDADGKLETVYTIHMRDDIKFSDGHAANIDDIIFYMYVILDPAYDGSSTLSSISIVGLQEYLYNNSKAGEVNAADVLKDIANQPELQERITSEVILPLLTSELEWVKTLYGDPNYASYTEAYPEYKDLFYVFYGTEEGKDTTAMTEQEIFDEVAAAYGYDYVALATAYGDPAYLDGQATKIATEVALANIEGGEPVTHISGIERVDDYTVKVTTEGFMANAVYQICAATITPMHYYGDEAQWDYEAGKFGFPNRTPEAMDPIKSKTDKPMGAGPYKFVEYKDKRVFFEANENYFLGAPKTKYMQWVESSEADYITGVASGALDVANPSGSVAKMQEIAQQNTDTQDINGNKITSSLVWNLGYGYIGYNASKMNVAGDPDSDASKNLRKGFATMMAVYREIAYDSYYGSAAAVIEYPISNTSWAAPVPGDEGYQVAFSVDVEGNPIYTEGMTQEQKEEAALQAAIGFFKAAGYTFDEATGKFTAAPEGASLEYEMMIPGEGTGDHPNFNIVDFAREKLETIGIIVKINDLTDTTVLWDALDIGEQEMWSAAWGSTIDPDMYQVYYSGNVSKATGGDQNSSESNHYHIQDDELDDLIMAARTSDDNNYRKTAYKQCLDIIMDWAVELPGYQRKNLIIFSTERINMDTVTKDITTYWGWMAEIEKLELKANAAK